MSVLHKIGQLNDANLFCVNVQEISRVQAHFKAFYLNRLQSHAIKRDERVKDLQNQDFKTKNTFKPQLAASK